jgi:cyclopropane fatty-acyl-phospholipid synthase-like methyltransferase
MMRSVDAEQVRRFYDRHTSAFVSFGQRGSNGAIHRAVWGPGTSSRRQAFRYVEDRIAELVRQLPPSFEASHVVDLGCGVGASLCYLAERVPVCGTGITLSPVQARFAQRRIRDAGLSDRLRCVEGDYCDLPGDVGPADLAYAIESFVHGSTPARFFEECRRLVRPGGLLVICDDFRRSADEAATRTIEQFCRGWHVNTLLDRENVRALARAAGFEHESTEDLSPYLEIRRARDRAGDVMLRLIGSLPLVATRFDYLWGGSALQTCLERGWIGYDLARFRRVD